MFMMIEIFAEQIKTRLEFVPDGNVFVMFSPSAARKLAAEIDALLDEKQSKIILSKAADSDIVFSPERDGKVRR